MVCYYGSQLYPILGKIIDICFQMFNMNFRIKMFSICSRWMTKNLSLWDRSATIHLPNFVWKAKIIKSSLTSNVCFCIYLIQQFSRWQNIWFPWLWARRSRVNPQTLQRPFLVNEWESILLYRIEVQLFILGIRGGMGQYFDFQCALLDFFKPIMIPTVLERMISKVNISKTNSSPSFTMSTT